MRKSIIISFAMVVCAFWIGSAFAETYRGRIVNDIFAIGGETTGIGIQTEDHFYELIAEDDLREELERFDGISIEIDGEFTLLHGVETSNRPAIIVESYYDFEFDDFRTVVKNDLKKHEDCSSVCRQLEGLPAGFSLRSNVNKESCSDDCFLDHCSK